MIGRDDRRAALAAGAACGVSCWLAMPGVGGWPFAFITFLPLYLLEPKRASDSVLAGFTAGVVATLGVCAWVPASMQLMLRVPLTFGRIALGLICAWHGLRFATLAWLNHRARLQGVPGWFRLPLSLVAAELLVPVPFPFSFAVTVHQLPVLLQIADLTGRLGIVLVLGASTAAIGDALRAVRAATRARGNWKSVCFGLAPLAASLAYGATRQPQVERDIARAAKLEVGMVQVNLGPEQKRSEPARSLDEHVHLTEELLRARVPDLIVWSETADPAPLDERLLSNGLTRRFGRPFAAPLLVGVVAKHELGHDRVTLTNSVVLSAGDGYVCPECRYDKQTLVPLGESVLSRSAGFSSGTHDRALPFDGGHRIGVLICFESIFPQRVRAFVRRERPQLLVNLTNDGWFGSSEEPRLHFALVKLRAVEHRLFLVRVAATGISAIIDPVGRAVVTIPHGIRQAKVGSVAWLDAATVYDRLGDAPWWCLTVGIALAGSSRLKRLGMERLKKHRLALGARVDQDPKLRD